MIIFNNQIITTGVLLDNEKESFYINFSIDGLIIVSDEDRAEMIGKISALMSELLSMEGFISGKETLNVISELEVAGSLFSNNEFN